MIYKVYYTENDLFCKDRFLSRCRENVGFEKTDWRFLGQPQREAGRGLPLLFGQVKKGRGITGK